MATLSPRPASARIARLLALALCLLFSARMLPQFNYYYGNIHSQTSYSDGNQDSSSSGITKPLQAFNYANASQHIDFYGISDHNHLNAGMTSPAHFHMGIADANTANADGSFVALYGQEWGVISGGGHVIVYGCDSLMGWDSNDYDIYVPQSNYTTLWSKINARPNAFAYLAHPQQTDYSNLFTGTYSSSADNAIVGLAARSGPAFSTNTTYSDPSSSSYIARYNDALAKGYHLGVGLDHDTHNSVFGRQTAGRLVVLAAGLTRYDVLDAIRKMRMYSSDDWNVKVDFNVSNQPMGSAYAHAGPPTLNVSVTDPDAEATSSIKIYYGVPGSGTAPAVLTSNTNSASLVYTHSAAAAGSVHYYYAEITQSDGDIVWTSPIWYTVNSAITANPPVTSFSVPASACIGQAIQLTDLSTNTPTAWQWTMVGATTNSAVVQNPAVTYTAAGTYTIALISSNGTGTGVPYTKTVTVGGSAPLLSISGNSSACSGSSVSLTASGATSYTWSTGAVSNSIVVSPASTTVYTLTGSNGGCASAITKTITVGSSPTVSINGPGTTCAGSPVVITASGAGTYTWSNSASSASISVSPTVTTSYTVTGTSSGCSGTSAKTITVYALPSVAVSGQGAICSGASDNLSASGASSYTWSTSQTGNSISVSPSGTTTYSVTGTDANGCRNTATKTVAINQAPAINASGGSICPGNSFTLSPSGASTYTYSSESAVVSPSSTQSYTISGTGSNGCQGVPVTVTVTVSPSLPVSITGPNAICAGSPLTLTASGATTYTWSTGATGNSVSSSPSASSSYSVTGSNGNGCSGTGSISVVVNALPAVSAASGSAMLCQGQTGMLTASGASTYTWSTGATGSSISVSPPGTTTYSVSGTDSQGCMGSAMVTQSVSVCTGIASFEGAAGYRVYPNPNNGSFAIETETPATITVYDVLGNALLSRSLEKGRQAVDISGQANGLYYLKVSGTGHTGVTKVVKQ